MNVRDLQSVITTNSTVQQRKYDGLTNSYIMNCREFLNSDRDNFLIYKSSFIGIPITSISKESVSIGVRNETFFISEEKRIEDYKEILTPFNNIDSNILLYNDKSEAISFSSLVYALEAAGFKVYVHKERKYLVPFFPTKLV